MRISVRPSDVFLAALVGMPLSMNALPLLAQVGSPPPAASADEPAPKQIPLTQKIIDQIVATHKAIHDAQSRAPSQSPEAAQAKVELIAKSNGFATPQDFANASYSVGMVLAGLDGSGNYIGTRAATQKQIDEVKADTKMSADEKKETLDELNEALKSADTEKPSQGNIDLVRSNVFKLAAAIR